MPGKMCTLTSVVLSQHPLYCIGKKNNLPVLVNKISVYKDIVLVFIQRTGFVFYRTL